MILESNSIIPEGLDAPWQTGTSLKVCRLAFNLYNGYCKECTRDYTTYELFDTAIREYMWKAVQLRFESGCQSTRTYDRNDLFWDVSGVYHVTQKEIALPWGGRHNLQRNRNIGDIKFSPPVKYRWFILVLEGQKSK